MKNLILVGAILVATAVSVGSAKAQSANDVEKPFTIKLGAFLPSSGEVRDEAGKSFFSVGGEYDLGKTIAQVPTVPLVYVDYNGRSKSGAHDYSTGVGLGVKQYLGGGPDKSTTPYVGAGVGAYFDQVHLNSGDESKTNVGYKLDAGLEFAHSYVVEADYQDAGSAAGTRLNGVNLLVGVRF